ncbi:PhzF family phenazine biosynthesis protein [Planosporangium thailandense]|uniref:PhzF family phenazine biosynthesis protein n=1 Tax=Planosporangium thailandense TaxID=765197 RepID=A0ABX0XW44_9ACTN|nr:PhzF family phenazine biosynthesis protein [Planosporangium thailandense]NJC69595.1 PhzF family phenazine biosynthesis protein [Planosporangium thailandense]
MSLHVTIVHACQRAGRGGSPTAVVDETALSDAERRAVPVAAGTSHVVFISTEEHGPDRPTVSLRFFTATGELPACGHGTVAALAVLAARARMREYKAVLRSGGRTFLGEATARDGGYNAVFDPGPVELRAPTTAEREPVLSALNIDAGEASARCHIASVGRPRMLVQVSDRGILADLTPNMLRLREACDRSGLLGCYVYSTPSPDGRAAARMFAPSIGVPEDIANANSTACLAAHLADRGFSTLDVDMGDSLGEPATIAANTRSGLAGSVVLVGGTATITRGLFLI